MTKIQLYAETRRRGEWRADTAPSFILDDPNRFGWTNARMDPLPCPEDYRLFGLLVDEVRCSWPWSFIERGLPHNTSQEVLAMSRCWGVDGYGHSHIGMDELVDKLSELVLSARPEARELQPLLCALINNLADANPLNASPEQRRIVFWFNN